jgi:uncharacterized membrane protein YkvA (DUF1232 family)
MVQIRESFDGEGRKISRRERGRLRRRMKDLLLLLPNLVKLVARLVRDPRVSRTDKIILGSTILYVITPLDFLPDMIPFLGQVDDTYLVAISLLRILNRADAQVVADHWRGEIDVKRLVTTIVETATFFLPKPIRAALTARMEIREPRALRVVGGAGEKKPAKRSK